MPVVVEPGWLNSRLPMIMIMMMLVMQIMMSVMTKMVMVAWKATTVMVMLIEWF